MPASAKSAYIHQCRRICLYAGCSPQACSYRDRYVELVKLGAAAVYGISTQSTDYQAEAQQRLHLPFPLLSDSELQLTQALNLPTFKVSRAEASMVLQLWMRHSVIALYADVGPKPSPAGQAHWKLFCDRFEGACLGCLGCRVRGGLTAQVPGVGELVKRLTLIIKDGEIAECFYPIFPSASDAGKVLSFLQQQQTA